MRIAHLLSGVVLTSALGLQSCQQEPLKMPAREEYAREFYKNFKNVDPDHDWNQAQKSSVTVKTSRPSSIKVMADIKGKRYLFADYREASGSNEIPLTLPKSVTDIIVKVNGQNFPAKLGATVDASSASSRAIWDDKTKDPVVGVKRTENYREISDKAVRSFAEYLPEGKDNRGKVTENFTYISSGPFTVYPVYWKTSQFNTLGIYYLKNEGTDEETMVFVPFYTAKMLRQTGGNSDGNLQYLSKEFRFDGYPAQTITGSGTIGFYEWDKDNYINGKWKISEFNDEDWAVFENRTKSLPLTNLPNGLSMPQDFWLLKPEAQEKGKIESFKYNKDESENKIVITEIQTYKIDPFELSHTDANWQYPGSGLECSLPDYEEYKKRFDEIDDPAPYNTKYDKIVADGFKPCAKWRSQGITIDIAPGTEFGMFIRKEGSAPSEESVKVREVPMIYNAERGYKMPDLSGETGWLRMFSQSKYNSDVMNSKDNPSETVLATHAATYDYHAPSGITYQVLGFEDWPNQDSDVDLNDVVFFIDDQNSPLKVQEEDDPDPEPESYQWIIAAEDLGGSYDWDFNDVVAGVSIQAMKEGEKEFSKVTVTPLASGGTLPVYFMYSGKIVDPKTGDPIANSDSDYVIGGEFHSLFGRDFGSFINASKDEHIKAEPIIFYTPAGHSLASSGHVHYDGTNMGGFWVLASEMNSPLDLNPANNYGLISIAPGTTTGFNKITNSKPIASEDLTAPQIICVETDWAWPLEEKNIKKAYPEFETWVGDESHRTWINNKNGELTVNR